MKTPTRLYVGADAVHCTTCLKHFGTRERLVSHLRYKSSFCSSQLMLAGPEITHEIANDIVNQLS